MVQMLGYNFGSGVVTTKMGHVGDGGTKIRSRGGCVTDRLNIPKVQKFQIEFVKTLTKEWTHNEVSLQGQGQESFWEKTKHRDFPNPETF